MSNLSADQKEAGLMQMRINTRLTALQTALELMKIEHYKGEVDHIMLLAMAGDVEKYIIDDLAEEARKAIDAAKNTSKIIQVRP